MWLKVQSFRKLTPTLTGVIDKHGKFAAEVQKTQKPKQRKTLELPQDAAAEAAALARVLEVSGEAKARPKGPSLFLPRCQEEAYRRACLNSFLSAYGDSERGAKKTSATNKSYVFFFSGPLVSWGPTSFHVNMSFKKQNVKRLRFRKAKHQNHDFGPVSNQNAITKVIIKRNVAKTPKNAKTKLQMKGPATECFSSQILYISSILTPRHSCCCSCSCSCGCSARCCCCRCCCSCPCSSPCACSCCWCSSCCSCSKTSQGALPLARRGRRFFCRVFRF